jgi:dTDP-4-dehydrorhamnose 3,5-epimerase
MRVTPTSLPGLLLLESQPCRDERGFLMESFNQRDFEATTGQRACFVQDNLVVSRRRVLRGLHYQLPPHAQGKLVRVIRGSAFDVVVDVRRGSPTFGRWSGMALDATSHVQIWIPPGFAHGVLALEEDTQMLYKTTDFYAKHCERAIAWNDPTIGICWPEQGLPPLLSPRDAAAGPLATADLF